jgi:hypothetical protein
MIVRGSLERLVPVDDRAHRGARPLALAAGSRRRSLPGGVVILGGLVSRRRSTWP